MNCVCSWLMNGVIESGSRWSAWLCVARRASASTSAGSRGDGTLRGNLYDRRTASDRYGSTTTIVPPGVFRAMPAW